MIGGWLPWEIDHSQFSPQSQSSWSPQLPPSPPSSLPPPSQSPPLTHALGKSCSFSHRRERGKFAGRAKESEDTTGDPSGPAVCRLLSRAEPVADDLPGTAAAALGGVVPGPAGHIHRSRTSLFELAEF